VRFTKRFPRSVATAICSLCAVLLEFVLVLVSFICSFACVGLLYRSSICACVTFILFVFREQKVVQRIQEIVAKNEDRLRQMQSVPRLSYGREGHRLGSGYFFSDLTLSCRSILIIFT